MELLSTSGAFSLQEYDEYITKDEFKVFHNCKRHHEHGLRAKRTVMEVQRSGAEVHSVRTNPTSGIP